MSDHGVCACCKTVLTVESRWYELARLPGGAITGELWRACSLLCLEWFVRGGPSR